MRSYNPDRAPPSDEWLEMDDVERIVLVESYHHRRKIKVPNAEAHAIAHVIVENQLAKGELVVVETLARLQKEGLDRHDTIHAIGFVITTCLHELMRKRPKATGDVPCGYFERLRGLTAKTWQAS